MWHPKKMCKRFDMKKILYDIGDEWLVVIE